MDELEAVRQFHAAGASRTTMLMVYDFNARALDALLPDGGRLLDLGVGSGRALAYLARQRPDLHITGVDLAPNMLRTARDLILSEGLDTRIELVRSDITALPELLNERSWDGISCVWTLHQLPDFTILRAALRQIAELRKRTGAAVWLLDFARLRDPHTFESIMDVLDPPIYPVLHRDALASEAAAFTREELGTELRSAGLTDLRDGYSRPIPWLQAFWASRADGRPGRSTGCRPANLPHRARVGSAMLRRGFSAKPF